MGQQNGCCESSATADSAILVEASPTDGKAVIRVVGAKGVRPRNWKPSETDDCWCVVSLGGQEVFRTKHVRNMLEPVWREEQAITGFGRGKEVEFSIMDANGCLGKTTVAWCRSFNGEVALQDSEALAVLRLKVRHPSDNGYPPGPPTEFKFRASRTSTDVKWGMRLDTQNTMGLLVDRVEETGPVFTSNSEGPPAHCVKKHDVLVEVNGAIGNSGSAMMNQFAEKTDVMVTVRRTVQIVVALERESVDTSIGMEFPPKPKGTSLVIVKLLHGLVSDYNASENDDSLKINPGDRVMAVNGEEHAAEGLIKKLSEATGTIRLSVLKLVPTLSDKLIGGKAYWYYGDGL